MRRTINPLKRSAEYWRQVAALAFSVLAGVKVALGLGGSTAWWNVVLACVVVALAGLAYRYVREEERRRSPVASGMPAAIADANKKWLGESGRVLIVTRDMSWVINDEVETALHRKASNGDLTIFAWRNAPLFDALRAAGADIHILAGNPPSVRFTILRSGASDQRVLVHRQKQGVVEFFEVGPSDFPTYGLARDVIDLLYACVANAQAAPRVGEAREAELG
jgi:hypothetical protein